MTDDQITAAMDQLAAQREQITRLDAREAGHFTALTSQLSQLADAITQPGGDDADRYQPGQAPPWWQLAAADRAEPIARLRVWVEQVYRPGYGHLAATLAPCWEAHDLCLYALDIAAALWAVADRLAQTEGEFKQFDRSGPFAIAYAPAENAQSRPMS